MIDHVSANSGQQGGDLRQERDELQDKVNCLEQTVGEMGVMQERETGEGVGLYYTGG